jgi:hypothetical protein
VLLSVNPKEFRQVFPTDLRSLNRDDLAAFFKQHRVIGLDVAPEALRDGWEKR